MLVKEIMTKKVITIEKDQSVFKASLLYKNFKIGSLILTDNGKCVGIITERDIIERTICERKKPEETKVEEIMSSDLITIHTLDSIEKAIETMINNNIKKLPVLTEEGIVGIITVTDISKAIPDISKRFFDSWVKLSWID